MKSDVPRLFPLLGILSLSRARFYAVIDDARSSGSSSEPVPLAKGKAGDCRDRGTAAELRRFFGRRGIAVRLLPVERRPDLR
jgi:hypothetical protein